MRNTFGKYELLERLGKGGMAEVYLARLAGPMGVSRYVALKRMLTDMSNDRLSQMFVDEVRLAVRLTHPNIVAVYDFGLEGDNYFLAMEFVEGCDVHQILKRASRSNPPKVEVECFLYIIAQVARGLDYAHRLTDGQGRPAQIVHRDVSPANIMVTYSGDVKLADFGIARAAQHLRQTATEAGEIKGKIRYMSPEQARGEPVDMRTDLFALGTVLLELMTLRPAFAGESDIASLLQVQAGVPNDWEARKKTIPADVLPIIQHAMAVDREQRFANGEAMAEACELALRRRAPGFGPSKLSAFMQSMFANEQTEWRRRIQNYEAEAAAPASQPEEAGPRTPVTNRAVLDALPPPPSSMPTPTPRSASTPQSGSLATGELAPPPQADRPRGLVYAGVAVVAMALGGGAMVFMNRPSAATPPAATTPAPTAATPPATTPTSATPTAAIGSPTVGSPTAPGLPTGRLVLSTNAVSTRVYLDHSPTERSATPVAAGGMSFKVAVPSGVSWLLRVEADGFKTTTVPLTIGPGEETMLPIVLVPDGPAAPAPAPKRPIARGGTPKPRQPDAPGPTPPKPDEPKAVNNEKLVNPF